MDDQTLGKTFVKSAKEGKTDERRASEANEAPPMGFAL